MNPLALYGIGLIAVPVLLSLTLHEFGHARVAMAFGDHTARLMGRVTLNPLAHLDPLGTLCLLFGPVGWAKPVPVDPSRLRPRRIGDICVSLAGVGMNLALAVVAAVALNVLAETGAAADAYADNSIKAVHIGTFMLGATLQINLALIVFNLVPLFPLDGHHVVRELLPAHLREGFMSFQRRFGHMILLGLILLPRLAGRGAPSPIGWVMARTMFPAISVLLTDRAETLLYLTWARFSDFLIW